MSAKLEDLLLKQEQLNARIKDIQARENKKQRKADTRAKIIIGAQILKLKKRNRINNAFISSLCDEVENQRDRGFLKEWLLSKNILEG